MISVIVLSLVRFFCCSSSVVLIFTLGAEPVVLAVLLLSAAKVVDDEMIFLEIPLLLSSGLYNFPFESFYPLGFLLSAPDGPSDEDY